MIRRLLMHAVAFLLSCVALGVTQSAEADSTPRIPSRMTQCAFIPDGFFYLKGSPPAGFADFDYIELLISDGGRRRPASDSRLHTSNGESIRFTNVTFPGTHSSGWGVLFEFETEMIEGIRYQITGKFNSICVFAEDELDPKKVIADGRISKLKDGKEVATAQVQLTYSKARRPSVVPNGKEQTSVRYPHDASDIIAFVEAFSHVDFSVNEALRNLDTVERANYDGKDRYILLTPSPSDRTMIRRAVLEIFKGKPDRVNIEYSEPILISYGELVKKYGSPSRLKPPVYKCKPGVNCQPAFVGYSFSYVPDQENLTSGKRLEVAVDLKMKSSKVVPQHTDKDFLAVNEIRFRRL